MNKYLPIAFLLIFITQSCNQKTEQNYEYKTLEKVPDSIKVGNITILNLFKYQIIAHKNNQYDSVMIVQKVYNPHKDLWNNCYGMLFGEENAPKFNNKNGMIEWNRNIYPENKDFFDQRVKEVLTIDLEKTLNENLTKFHKLVPYQPQAKISILFTPLQGIGFGGCNSNEFCFELNNTDYNVAYTIEKGIPHELNHLVYEKFREKQTNCNSALTQTIDEGFACYFTWLFFDKKEPKYEFVEEMNANEWKWYLNNEKKIYSSLKTYFDDESGDNPLLRNDKFKLFVDAPKSLNYWLGFRIVEKYIENNGKDSWKDIYELDSKTVLQKSGYEEYIKTLK